MTRFYAADEVDALLEKYRQRIPASFTEVHLILKRLMEYDLPRHVVTPRQIGRHRTSEELAPLLAPVVERVRSGALDTSVQAAQMTSSETAERAWEVLLRIYRDIGPSTDDEAFVHQQRYGRSLTQNTLRPRRSDLVTAGLVCASHERRLSAAGRPATVWMLIPEKEQLLREESISWH